MNAELPDPLVPADVDLRDFQFMPIDVHRLLSSETWMLGTGEEKAASMTLWLESWRQVPAGSLPKHDKMLAHLSQSGAKWASVRDHVLKGWVLCSDGRYYHPVVAEKAMEAWNKKQAFRDRTEKARQARLLQRKQESNKQSVTASVTDNVTDNVTESRGTGTGTGTGTGNNKDKDYDANASLSADIAASVDSASQGTENESKKVEDDGTNGKSPPCPHQKIIDLYHKHLGRYCPKVRIWEGQRPKKLQTLWRQNPDLEWWDGFFEYCSESKFLTGRATPRQGSPPFVATMEWLISPRNFQKIYEGIYHRA